MLPPSPRRRREWVIESIASSSKADYGRLRRKYREVLTLTLPIDRLRQVLRECGLELIEEEDQSDLCVAQSAETPIHPTLKHSWSVDSLGSISSAIIPLIFNGEAPALNPGDRKANVLKTAIFAITNSLVANVATAGRSQLIELFIEPEHLRLLDSLIRRGGRSHAIR